MNDEFAHHRGGRDHVKPSCALEPVGQFLHVRILPIRRQRGHADRFGGDLEAVPRGERADQVDAVLRDVRPRRIARTFSRQQGEVQDPEGRDRGEGEALPQVVGLVETRVLNSRKNRSIGRRSSRHRSAGACAHPFAGADN
ncbi:MAG: hypothetical protein OXN84_15010 [Albidovulum sp.]|nr:hypothetical protein [Albidovulum sp.]